MFHSKSICVLEFDFQIKLLRRLPEHVRNGNACLEVLETDHTTSGQSLVILHLAALLTFQSFYCRMKAAPAGPQLIIVMHVPESGSTSMEMVVKAYNIRFIRPLKMWREWAYLAWLVTIHKTHTKDSQNKSIKKYKLLFYQIDWPAGRCCWKLHSSGTTEPWNSK